MKLGLLILITAGAFVLGIVVGVCGMAIILAWGAGRDDKDK